MFGGIINKCYKRKFDIYLEIHSSISFSFSFFFFPTIIQSKMISNLKQSFYLSRFLRYVILCFFKNLIVILCFLFIFFFFFPTMIQSKKISNPKPSFFSLFYTSYQFGVLYSYKNLSLELHNYFKGPGTSGMSSYSFIL